MASNVKKKRARRSAWRAGFGPDEVIQRVRPAETDAYLHNPHRGTTTFQRFNGDPLYPDMWWNDREGPEKFKRLRGNADRLRNRRYPRTTLAYCRWLWSVIEPEKGNYRWNIIDGALDAARQRGQTLQMRIQPFIGDSTPSWYWDLGGKPVRKGSAEPDHNHPAYRKHWGELIRAMGRQYDGHPALECFDVAYGGSCGETGGNTHRTTARRLVDVYRRSFRKTQLVSMLGTHGCAYAATLKRPFGWRADCFGDLRANGQGRVPDPLCWNHMYDLYPREIFECGVQEAWKTAPVTFETCWTVPYWIKQGWDIDWILEQGLMYHPTVFMPKSCYIPEPWREKIDAFDRKLGYRFVLRQMLLPLDVRRGGRFRLELSVDNLGVAPIYRPYRPALRFRQGKRQAVVPIKTDIRTWMPGNTWFETRVTTPPELRSGTAEVHLGILDETSDTPRVRMAIEPVNHDGWHPLTHVDVE